MRLAVDVMGGDHGPAELLSGVQLGLAAEPALKLVRVVGREEEIRPILKRIGLEDPRLEVVNATEVLTMDDKPVQALRRKKDCSLLRAVDQLKAGEVDAVISAGNTGGIVAAATIRLRTLEGVDRPTIACIMPTGAGGAWILVDGGANPECEPGDLLQFGLMGSAYSRAMLGVDRPRVGVLSNGTEEGKGTPLTRAAVELIRQSGLNGIGHCEGHQLFAGEVDVVVCDGFVGNIVLKTAESLGKAMRGMLREELTATPVRKVGALLARRGLERIRDRMNPDAYGGAPLLGINGTVIKVHGSARRVAVMNAIRQSSKVVSCRLNESIVRDVAASLKLKPAEESRGPSAAPPRE